MKQPGHLIEGHILTRTEYVNPRRKVAGKRFLECVAPQPVHTAGWTPEMRGLLADIMKSDTTRRAWTTLASRAGAKRLSDLHAVVEALLMNGCVRVEERLSRGEWSPAYVEMLDIDLARQIAGLPNRRAIAAAAEAARRYLAESEYTRDLLAGLNRCRPDLVPRRVAIIRSLDAWMREGRHGTRRDFALYATGETKGIGAADWRWLHEADALEWAGIIEHEPFLLVGGRFSLRRDSGLSVDLGGALHPLGITPGALEGPVTAVVPSRWVVFENRTVFDRAARIRTSSAILWVPGYAPGWWLSMVGRLIELAPAAAVLACDPDPAGIEIAHRAAGPWRAAGLSWAVAGMDGEALQALTAPRPQLTAADRATLERCRDLIDGTPLETCHEALGNTGEKGEQEGYWSVARLNTLLADDSVKSGLINSSG